MPRGTEMIGLLAFLLNLNNCCLHVPRVRRWIFLEYSKCNFNKYCIIVKGVVGFESNPAPPSKSNPRQFIYKKKKSDPKKDIQYQD
jgi:hypothetical protein